ncbi:hypothetical protein [Amycolatopsis anabasis]|uniref:hypothetical protein n=1 Tax=Amycolatopsis anabasis TaxID=1840409 RepID=UPI00131BEBD5|nr:hypothetical protein [Amycolatopsis anabasis]
MSYDPVGRRAFLARIGLLGAAATVGGGALLGSPQPAAAASSGTQAPTDPVVGLLRDVLAELSRDTINGLVTFVVPGPDGYSRAQGTPRQEPGALEAGTTDYVLSLLDTLLPFPEAIGRPLASALATATSELDVPLLGPLTTLLPPQLRALDAALGAVVGAQDPLPLAFPVAGLLNLLATQVNPASVNGPFLSPFSRLSFAEKARVFELLERSDSDLAALLDTNFPEPTRAGVSALMKFLATGLLGFSAFGAFSEWNVFDPRTRTISRPPVGWQLTGYEGRHEGENDFKGYWQGRTEVHD